MDRNIYLANRLREVLLDGTWIANTNYKHQLEQIGWKQATEKVGELNSIAALTFHIRYYLDGLLNVLRGGALEIRDKYSYDLAPIATEEEWRDLVTSFLSSAEAFVQAVSEIPDNQLNMPFIDEKYGSYLRNIEGVIEHSYYHLGQISLIRKLNSEKLK